MTDAHNSTFISVGVSYTIDNKTYEGGWIPVTDNATDIGAYIALRSASHQDVGVIKILRTDGAVVDVAAKDLPAQLAHLSLPDAHLSLINDADEALLMEHYLTTQEAITCDLQLLLEPTHKEMQPLHACYHHESHALSLGRCIYPIAPSPCLQELATLVILHPYCTETTSSDASSNIFESYGDDIDALLKQAHATDRSLHPYYSYEAYLPHHLDLDIDEVMCLFEPANRTHTLWTDLFDLYHRAKSTPSHEVSDALTYALVQFMDIFGAFDPNDLPVLRQQGRTHIQYANEILCSEDIDAFMVKNDYVLHYRPQELSQHRTASPDDQLTPPTNLSTERTVKDYIVRAFCRHMHSGCRDHLTVEVLDNRQMSMDEANVLAHQYMRFVNRLQVLAYYLAHHGDSPTCKKPTLSELSQAEQMLDSFELNLMLSQHANHQHALDQPTPITVFHRPTDTFHNIWQHYHDADITDIHLWTRSMGIAQELTWIYPQLARELRPFFALSSKPSCAQIVLRVNQGDTAWRIYDEQQGWLKRDTEQDNLPTYAYSYAFIYAYQLFSHIKQLDQVHIQIHQHANPLRHCLNKIEAARSAMEALSGLNDGEMKVEVQAIHADTPHAPSSLTHKDTLIISRSSIEQIAQEAMQINVLSNLDTAVAQKMRACSATPQLTSQSPHITSSRQASAIEPMEKRHDKELSHDDSIHSDISTPPSPQEAGDISEQISPADDEYIDKQSVSTSPKAQADYQADLLDHASVDNDDDNLSIDPHPSTAISAEPPAFMYVPTSNDEGFTSYQHRCPIAPWLAGLNLMAQHSQSGLFYDLTQCSNTAQRVQVLLKAQEQVRDTIIGRLIQSTINHLIDGAFDDEDADRIVTFMSFTQTLQDSLPQILELLFTEQYDVCLTYLEPLIEMIYDHFSLVDTAQEIWRFFQTPGEFIHYHVDMMPPHTDLLILPKICIDLLNFEAVCLLRTGDTIQAKQRLEHIICIAPARAEGVLQLAYLYEQEQNLSAMQHLLADHIPYMTDVDDIGVCYYRLAFALYKQELHEASIVAYLLSAGLPNRRQFPAYTEMFELFEQELINQVASQLSPQYLQDLNIPLPTCHTAVQDLAYVAQRMVEQGHFDTASAYLQDINAAYRSPLIDQLLHALQYSVNHHSTET